jgi:hypothetical protein
MSHIAELDTRVGALSHNVQELFNRFYSLKVTTGHQMVPAEMVPWVKARFRSIERVEAQRIVSIKNRFTGEHSLFNQLRTERPIEAQSQINIVEIEDKEHCLFCYPETNTPADVFGRIKGKYCITASNIAKYDALHSLIIFKEHNPLLLQKEWLADYLNTAERWFEEVMRHWRESKVQKFFLWNCLWKGGASIIHGHMQLTATKERYGKLEALEKAAANYNREFNADYFEDLYTVHEQLGLARAPKKGEKILCYLTPIKEKEIIMLSRAKRSDEMADTLYTVLKSYLDMGVQSFNLAIFPLHDGHIVRLVDRGSLSDRTSDFGAMELYAASVISSDPFTLARVIFS